MSCPRIENGCHLINTEWCTVCTVHCVLVLMMMMSHERMVTFDMCAVWLVHRQKNYSFSLFPWNQSDITEPVSHCFDPTHLVWFSLVTVPMTVLTGSLQLPDPLVIIILIVICMLCVRNWQLIISLFLWSEMCMYIYMCLLTVYVSFCIPFVLFFPQELSSSFIHPIQTELSGLLHWQAGSGMYIVAPVVWRWPASFANNRNDYLWPVHLVSSQYFKYVPIQLTCLYVRTHLEWVFWLCCAECAYASGDDREWYYWVVQ